MEEERRGYETANEETGERRRESNTRWRILGLMEEGVRAPLCCAGSHGVCEKRRERERERECVCVCVSVKWLVYCKSFETTETQGPEVDMRHQCLLP